MLKVLVTILTGCDIHNIACNNTVKGVFAGQSSVGGNRIAEDWLSNSLLLLWELRRNIHCRNCVLR